MKRRTFLKNTSGFTLTTLVTPLGIFQQKKSTSTPKDLLDNFKIPPDTAKPHTWWHWMNGNVTQEGITLDLEAMKRIGLGGFQNFDAGTGIPKGPVEYLSEDWLALKKHAIREAERLGLEFTMHNCPGWSSSGGPWITPELSMQEITWSETFLAAGEEAKNQSLPQPLTRLNHYKDIALLAYPSLPEENLLTTNSFKLSSHQGAMFREQLQGEIKLESNSENEQVYLQFEFEKPCELRSLSFLALPLKGGKPGPLLLQASDDGNSFTNVHTLIGGGGGFGDSDTETLVTADFKPTKATYFRLLSTQARSLNQLRFSNINRAPDWQKRANFAYNGTAPEKLSTTLGIPAIPLDAILDISDQLNAAGQLTWTPPNKNHGWTILRLGYTSLGTLNRSAPDTGIGLECDKYSKTALDFHFNKMMENLLPSLQSLGAKGKVGLLIDSYEVGMQNWTSTFEEDFKKHNGYELRKFLPAFTGRIVENPDTTDRFLWDIRRTQGDLMADNYYGHFTHLCHQNNIISYCQPYDRGPMDELQIGSRIDINVGEFWNNLSAIFQNNRTMRRTVKLSASIAHTNGQSVVAAESFTGEPESAKWQSYPFGLKALGDKMFTQGLNRMIFHRFAHQPHPTAVPGMTMGPWGIHMERTNTWWEQGKTWMEYLTRCQYLLQEGLFVADLAYFTGEDAGVYAQISRDELVPSPPEGYDYDIIHPEAILNRVKIVNNRLVLPDGMSYGLLILPPDSRMTLAFLRKLHALVNEGMVVYGDKPLSTPGLQNHSPASEEEFRKLCSALWAEGMEKGSKIVGKGHMYWGSPLSDVLNQLTLKPDLEITSRSGDAPVTYIHRNIGETEVYFLANQRRTTEEIVCTFRVANKQPELWDAVTGEITQMGIYDSADGRTLVPLTMKPTGSLFVVFRSQGASSRLKAVLKENQTVLSTQAFPKISQSLHSRVMDNFTICLWVKPEFHAMLSTANFMGNIQYPWTDNYCIYPPAGSELYGQNHAACGLAVGRNGVAVWERAADHPLFALAAPVAISGWSHVALVYEQGTPSIYVNGQFIAKGKKSTFTVHPGTGKAYLEDGASYFNGDQSEPVLYKEALSETQIAELIQEEVSKFSQSLSPVQVFGTKKAALLFRENGTYHLQFNPGKNTSLKINNIDKPLDLSNDWRVSFPPKLGAPTSIELSKLDSLSKHAEPGVKYFSGTATYQKQFNLPGGFLQKGKRIFLDLGSVEMLAEVWVNAKNLGVLWTRPYQVDITEVLKAGVNELEIKVTNLWPNRLIGDEQMPETNTYTPGGGGSGFASLRGGGIIELPEWYQQGKPKPEDGRVTFTTWKHYTKDSPLLESGLIGPVLLKVAISKEI